MVGMWCQDCVGEAEEPCLQDSHSLLRPAEALSQLAAGLAPRLQGELQKDVATARAAHHAFKAGDPPSLQRRVPYAEDAARLLSDRGGRLRLQLRHGSDSIWNLRVDLPRPGETPSRQQVLAKLLLYLLRTKGRLYKKQIPRDGEKFSFYTGHVELVCAEPFQKKREKQQLLDSETLSKVTHLENLGCGKDPEWAARVLQVVSPRLESARVSNVGAAHLQILHAMPRLRHLDVWHTNDSLPFMDLEPLCWDEDADDAPSGRAQTLRFPAVPAHHRGLLTLKALLPKHAMIPLLVAHRRTLREFHPQADLPDEIYEEYGDGWANGTAWWNVCNDLPETLADVIARHGPFESLRLVQVTRGSHGCRDERYRACEEQLRAVRRVLGPGVVVRCNTC